MRFSLYVFGTMLCLGGCFSESSSPHVRFVIADGYKGDFVVTITGTGKPLNEANGTYIVKIPKSGVLEVRDDPFRNWHSLSAVFENGNMIPIAAHEDDPREKIVYFWSMSSSEKHIHYFIGTKSEYESFDIKTAKRFWD